MFDLYLRQCILSGHHFPRAAGGKQMAQKMTFLLILARSIFKRSIRQSSLYLKELIVYKQNAGPGGK